MQNATQIFGTIKKVLGIKTDTELSRVLEIQRPTLSTWKQRDSIDYKKIVSFCEKYNISLELVFLGKEPDSNNDDWKGKYINCLEEKDVLRKELNLILKNGSPKKPIQEPDKSKLK